VFIFVAMIDLKDLIDTCFEWSTDNE